MPDDFLSEDHQLIQPVTVRRHTIDWDDDQFDLMTARRALSWNQRLSRGCWFLNPRYSVHAEAPSVPFFRKVLEVQASWLKTVRKAIHNRGLRRKARQRDHLGRQLAFSGVLLFDGELIPPATWQKLADTLINPYASTISTIPRHLDLAALKATRDLNPLKQLAHSSLQAHLDDRPEQSALILPNVTISSPVASPAFYDAAERARSRWAILLKRTLGNGSTRQLRHADDPETYALVFGGILYADQELYWPGCWPNQTLKPENLERSPSQCPTVPLSFLGLKDRQSSTSRTPPIQRSTLKQKERHVDRWAINEEFKGLFGMTGL